MIYFLWEKTSKNTTLPQKKLQLELMKTCLVDKEKWTLSMREKFKDTAPTIAFTIRPKTGHSVQPWTLQNGTRKRRYSIE